MSITLTDQDKHTLRIAAYGAVTLLAAAGAAGTPHKIATNGTIALTLRDRPGRARARREAKGMDLNGKSVAELADQVLPALTAAMSLLKKQAPAEADNFRSTVTVAIEQPPGPTRASPARPWPRWSARSPEPSTPLDSMSPRTAGRTGCSLVERRCGLIASRSN